MNTSTEFSELKDKLPPSAREIYQILAAEEKGLTTKEVLNRVDYASRTVRYALKRLLSVGLVRKIPYLLDMRQSKYLVLKSKT
ncbi:MAG: helix-turn-helix domain-containing protein [Candidatus Heimdallarchaeota archaeon]